MRFKSHPLSNLPNQNNLACLQPPTPPRGSSAKTLSIFLQTFSLGHLKLSQWLLSLGSSSSSSSPHPLFKPAKPPSSPLAQAAILARETTPSAAGLLWEPVSSAQEPWRIQISGVWVYWKRLKRLEWRRCVLERMSPGRRWRR
jgi:hypothetical protein